MDQQRKNIRGDGQGDPILEWCAGEGVVANTAAFRDVGCMNLRQFWKRRAIFVIAVKGSRADGAAPKFGTAADFVWKPMEAVRGVGGKFLKAGHLANLGRDSHEAAAVDDEMFDGLESGDGGREGGDMGPLFRCHLTDGREYFALIGGGYLDEFEES